MALFNFFEKAPPVATPDMKRAELANRISALKEDTKHIEAYMKSGNTHPDDARRLQVIEESIMSLEREMESL